MWFEREQPFLEGGRCVTSQKKRLRRRLSVNVHWEVRSISFPAPLLLLSSGTGARGFGMIQIRKRKILVSVE